jgi:hypothetical protein
MQWLRGPPQHCDRDRLYVQKKISLKSSLRSGFTRKKRSLVPSRNYSGLVGASEPFQHFTVVQDRPYKIRLHMIGNAELQRCFPDYGSYFTVMDMADVGEQKMHDKEHDQYPPPGNRQNQDWYEQYVCEVNQL